jgi:hypothetical protein
MKTLAIAVFAVLACASSARSTTIPVAAGESIQAAINAAVDGDVVDVAAGTFDENIDFAGKAVRVVGADTASVIRGTGAGPVVTFAGAESADAVLEIPDHFLLRAGSRPRAVDGGNPDPLYADLDGTRNDIGFTGGPFAAP